MALIAPKTSICHYLRYTSRPTCLFHFHVHKGLTRIGHSKQICTCSSIRDPIIQSIFNNICLLTLSFENQFMLNYHQLLYQFLDQALTISSETNQCSSRVGQTFYGIRPHILLVCFKSDHQDDSSSHLRTVLLYLNNQDVLSNGLLAHGRIKLKMHFGGYPCLKGDLKFPFQISTVLLSCQQKIAEVL